MCATEGDWKIVVGDPGPPDIWSANPSGNDHENYELLAEKSVANPFFAMVGGKNTTVQLFNIPNDEREMQDVASANEELVRMSMSCNLMLCICGESYLPHTSPNSEE